MSIIRRGLAAGASAAAEMLAKDYERGQDVSAKKDLADHEANIRQRLQDSVNQFTMQLEGVRKQHQSELLNQQQQFQREMEQQRLNFQRGVHGDTMDLKKKELLLEARKLGIEDRKANALIDHYTSLASTPMFQGDDGRTYIRLPDGRAKPLASVEGPEIKVSSPKDFEKYANFLKILKENDIISEQQAKELMAKFMTGGDADRVRLPGEDGAGSKKGGLLDAARRGRQVGSPDYQMFPPLDTAYP
jgi:uncharacterized membrane protein YkoI